LRSALTDKETPQKIRLVLSSFRREG
jgi:hypothetical protein